MADGGSPQGPAESFSSPPGCSPPPESSPVVDSDGGNTDGLDADGAAARAARKKRFEQRETVRLNRVAQAVAARRSREEEKEQKRIKRLARKAAARRSAGGDRSNGEVTKDDTVGVDKESDGDEVQENVNARLQRLAEKVAQRRLSRKEEEDECMAESPTRKRKGSGSKDKTAKKQKHSAKGKTDDLSSDSSSLSSSTDSSDSSVSESAKAIAKALATGQPVPKLKRDLKVTTDACFGWEHADARRAAFMTDPVSAKNIYGEIDVERFILENHCDVNAAAALRQLSIHQQKTVIEKGSIAGNRNPSASLLARIRELTEGGRFQPKYGQLALCRDPEIEAMISKYNLDASASAALRGLPKDRLKEAMSLRLDGTRNPSAVVSMKFPVAF